MIFRSSTDEIVTLVECDMVIIDGVEYCIDAVYEDGTFEASDESGEMSWFDVDDVG